MSANFALSRSKNILPPRILITIYRSLFEGNINFGPTIWGAARPDILSGLEVLQKKAIRHVANFKYNSHTSPIFKQLKILKLSDLISYHQAMFIRQYKNKKLPNTFNNCISDIPESNMRSRDDDYNLFYPFPKKKNMFYYPKLRQFKIGINWTLE